MKTKENTKTKVITVNRRARYDYDIIDTWEAGLKLKGIEVKALRDNLVSISEAWIKLTKNGASLVSSSITPREVSRWESYLPTRDRILLLHKREINKLALASQRGFAIIPLRIYFNPRGLAKIEIATAKGRKKHDKRRAIQDRDQKRYGY